MCPDDLLLQGIFIYRRKRNMYMSKVMNVATYLTLVCALIAINYNTDELNLHREALYDHKVVIQKLRERVEYLEFILEYSNPRNQKKDFKVAD